MSDRAVLVADTGLKGRALCRALTEDADRWLSSLLAESSGVALVAVGGYGRMELCPGSDLDVALVHNGRRSAREVATLADAVWYPVWDAGYGLDHSVRTVREALATAESDLKTALGLLDGRFLAGDESLARELTEKAMLQWQRHGRRRVESLADTVESRHARFGEVAFLLEPDLKEGRGGLRDVQALRALALISPVIDVDDPALLAAIDVLLNARIEVQRGRAKEQNLLLLQDQDMVADALGYADADDLMAAVAGAARTIAWASDDGWRRVRSWLVGPGRRGSADRPLGPGLVFRDGEVALAPDADEASDPSLPFRAGVVAAELGAALARPSLDRMAAATPSPGNPWPDGCLPALVGLLGKGDAALPVLETLDQRGLLVRLLPEWESVRSRPQRNAYHRFTVDRHLWETAMNAAAFTRRVSRPDLLLLGALLHDIGKGVRGRDHTEAGGELRHVVGARMGLPPHGIQLLAQV